MDLLAVYYLDPADGRRRKLVMPNAPAEQVEHYQEVASLVASGTLRPGAVAGLYGFAEVDLETGVIGPVEDMRLWPAAGIKTVRVEETEPRLRLVQGDLLGSSDAA